MHTFFHTYRSRCSMMRERFKWVIKNQKRALSMTSRRRKKRKSISNTCYETINHNQADFYECICNNIFHLTATSLNRTILSQFRAFQNISGGTSHFTNPLWNRFQFYITFFLVYKLSHAVKSGIFFILKLQFKANWQQRERQQ